MAVDAEGGGPLTAQPRLVVSRPDVLYLHALPAERGQHEPLAEEVAALVVESVAGHVVVVVVWHFCLAPSERGIHVCFARKTSVGGDRVRQASRIKNA